VVQLTRIAAEHSGDPVIIQSNDPWDFEALVAYPRFLAAKGATNDMYLLWQPEKRETSDFLESLSSRLTQYSQAGLPGEYRPLVELETKTEDCILVVLAGAPQLPCRVLVNGAWRGY
jgi:hypothetical protein